MIFFYYFFFLSEISKLVTSPAPQLAVYELISALKEQVFMEGDSTCQKRTVISALEPQQHNAFARGKQDNNN